MIKVRKPSSAFNGKVMLRYKGKNQTYFQERRFEKIVIKEIDYALNEELLVEHTMFDQTQIKFSMISANLYIKENEEIILKEDQNFCDFELDYDEKFMVFEGSISYEKHHSENFVYKEDYHTTIILPFSKKLFDIWVKHDNRIN
jgi:hypothetical protein